MLLVRRQEEASGLHKILHQNPLAMVADISGLLMASLLVVRVC